MAERPRILRFGGLVGASPLMKKVYGLIVKASKLDMLVLIAGETGTGKELVAREIHARGRRNNCPFVPVNTGALSSQLVASELFGHVKGSFTGAVENQLGRFAEADGGTLFLDEIATMEERTQIALLRVLDTGMIRPVGAKHDKKVDVRLIAATNADLRKAVNAGMFREDLLQRLQVFGIFLPPLRHHIQDLTMLLYHFLDMMNAEFGLNVRDIDPDAMMLLQEYPWPGNIRELKNVVAEAVVMAESGSLKPEHLPTRITAGIKAGEKPVFVPKEAELEGPVPMKTQGMPYELESGEPDAPPAGSGVYIPLGASLEEVQKTYVVRTLNYCSNNKTYAARVLGVSRKTLYDKLLRWGITKQRI